MAPLCRAGAGRVVIDIQLHRIAQALLQHRLHWRAVGGVEIRREPDYTGAVDEPRDADAGRHRGELTDLFRLIAKVSSPERGQQAAAQLLQSVDDAPAATKGGKSLFQEHAPMAVDDDSENFRASGIDADSGGRVQVSPSTFAFRSRIAACKMFPSARRLMNPGSGTLSSTTRL